MVEAPKKIPSRHKALFQDELLDSGFEFKDKNNLEVSFDYFLQKGVVKNDYSITGYFFIPPELKVSKETYSKQQFFHDFQSSIRFQTPIFPLTAIVNPENSLSPLNRIKKILDEIMTGKYDEGEINERLIYELKMHAQIVRSNLKNQVVLLTDLCPSNDPSEIEIETVQDLIATVYKIQEKFHEFEPIFFSVQFPERTRATYFAADEYVSYYIEHYFTVLLQKLETRGCYKELIPAIQEMIAKRQQRRKKMDYTLVIDSANADGSKNDKIHYWKSFLKSYIKQVLVLQTKEREDRKTLGQVIGALGAILAMLFFVIVTLLLLNQIAQYSAAFILILIIAYALKDRIKVLINTVGERMLAKWVSDKKYDIVDTLKKEKIGFCTESARFIKLDQVPDEVIKIRNKDRTSILEKEFTQENVILYRKHIKLYTEKITHIHERHKNINDVLRINIKNFLAYAWEPEEKILYFNSAEKKLVDVSVPIEYHFNMVLQQVY
nr:hypothetical protein [Candidatus Sigynarchaeota archaeon]